MPHLRSRNFLQRPHLQRRQEGKLERRLPRHLRDRALQFISITEPSSVMPVRLGPNPARLVWPQPNPSLILYRFSNRQGSESSSPSRQTSPTSPAKRSHGCQRVHIVPPLHDLSALDGNDRDEPVVVGGAGRDNFTMDIVFDDDNARVLRSVYDKRVSAVE